MIGISVAALKLNFKQDELPGVSRLVIMERKEKAMNFQGAGQTCHERIRTHAIPF